MNQEEKNNYIKTYGVKTILDRVRNEEYIPFKYELKEIVDDFKIVDKENPRFVQPFFSLVEDYSTSQLEEAQIILIEAIGAAGKTELTKYLSYQLQCPIFDLGKTKVVAGNSLSGLLIKRMQRRDSSDFMDNISLGKTTIIIDALDEGYLKTNNQGYLDFLDDVLSLAPQKECPIILLGRYNAVELAATFFVDANVKVVTVQIEPFTLKAAKEFIDKAGNSTAKSRFEAIYRDTRDYVLTKIGGFFKDQSSIKDHASERFIGYAPVLQSIAELFDERANYQVLLDELKESNAQSISLIIDIIKRILRRDREEKVFPILDASYLANRSDAFKREVKGKVYTDEEQCARVLYSVLQLPFPEIDIRDASFLSAYNEGMDTWIKEHPFMGKKKVANAVFESYIMALLIKSGAYKEVACDYLRKNGVSYMFVYMYEALYGLEHIDKDILPFIYNSLRELNNRQSFYSMHLFTQSTKEDSVVCNVEFEGSDKSLKEYSGIVEYNRNDVLDFGDKLEYLIINVPLDFKLEGRKVDVSAPSYIKCRNLTIQAEEITLYKTLEEATFVLECDNLLVEQKYDQYLQLVGPGKSENVLRLICPKRPDYPLYNCWTSESVQLKNLNDDLLKKYKKLRTIVLEFCSHSKHGFGKHHERIDFVHGNSDMGKAVIKALKDSKVMYQEDHLYLLDAKLMPSVLGLSYDGFRNLEINDTIVRFLNSI